MSSTSLKVHSSVKYSADLHSAQIWKTLVDLLFETAAPLAVYSTMSIETGLSCLALSTNNRRKISENNSDHFISDIFYELSLRVPDDSEQSKLDLLEYILNKGVERNIIVDHVAYSLAVGKFPKHIDKDKLNKFVAGYLKDYDTFKQDIVYRYFNLTKTFANRNHHNKSSHGLHSEKDDMFHVYLISAMRAVDRFIPTKGTITEYIQTWFQNAKGSSDYMVYDGEAISINRTVRRNLQEGDKQVLNTKAIPLQDRENSIPDDVNTEDKMNTTYPKFSRHLAKLKNSTIIFLAMNLPYVLSPEQIAKIKAAR